MGAFFLLKGERDALAHLRIDPEFTRLTTRAQVCVEDLGVVCALTGSSVSEAMSVYQEALGELT